MCNKKSIVSISTATCNEDQNRELSVEYAPTLWQLLLGRNGTAMTVVYYAGSWFDKRTNLIVDDQYYWDDLWNRVQANNRYSWGLL